MARIHARRRPLVVLVLVLALIATLLWLPAEQRLLMWRGLLLQRGLVASLFFYGLITLSLVLVAAQKIDDQVFLYVNLRGYRPKWLDASMWLLTQLGNGLTAFIVSIFLFFFADRGAAVSLLLGTITLWLVVETTKWITNRARPFAVHKTARVVGKPAPRRSFPSGHTAQAFLIITVLVRQFAPALWIAILLYAAAALVGLTRMYLGAHFPRDVVGGMVLGIMWGILASIIDPFWFVPLFNFAKIGH